jgi:DNA-directed RNA polymerase subunit P
LSAINASQNSRVELTRMMVEYKCFGCGKTVEGDQSRRRVRCPYCSSKVLFKLRQPVKKLVKAR